MLVELNVVGVLVLEYLQFHLLKELCKNYACFEVGRGKDPVRHTREEKPCRSESVGPASVLNKVLLPLDYNYAVWEYEAASHSD